MGRFVAGAAAAVLPRSTGQRRPSAVQGFSNDFANLIFGSLDLVGASGDVSWMEWALQVQCAQDELIWDKATGGWRFKGGV